MEPVVTIVIAAYNRPEILKKCIESVLLQSIKNWVMYVIGDNCSDETGEMIAGIDDPRIYYYNNPYRFGEQSGGNSIGIALAKTPYIAFLNHDDLWTPDHLEDSIIKLEKEQGDFFISGNFTVRKLDKDQPVTLKAVCSTRRKPWHTFNCNNGYFEPCSSWFVKTDIARKIGWWKQCLDIYRTPLQEYILRAWQKKVKFVFGENYTCIKINQYYKLAEKTKWYSYVGNEHEFILDLIKSGNDSIDNFLKKQKQVEKEKGSIIDIPDENKIEKLLFPLLINRFSAFIYYFFKIDFYNLFCIMTKRKKGKNMLGMLHKRTGEKLIARQDMELVFNKSKTYFKNSYDY